LKPAAAARLAALAVVLMGTSVTAFAAYVQAEVGLVTRMRTYNSYGTGDVVLWVQNAPSGCDGFWFRTTEPNGKEMFAQILASQKSQSSLYFTGYSDQAWPGSASVFCKIYSIDTYSN
jgi:hypothetical protein